MTTQSPIHEAVREHYADRIKNSASCCGDSCSCSENRLYPQDLISILPEADSTVSYGCGDPITLASLQPGQTVVDLGSGAGLDCFFAARKVGETGKVIGVDMTPEMLNQARASAKRMNLSNVEFREGYIESIPVDSDSADVIISNCVINLSPDKQLVFNEAFRVLKRSGKLAVSDIVTDGPLPDFVKKSMAAWAGCVAGAVDAKEYIGMMEAAGFKDISVKPVFFDRHTVDEALENMKDSLEMAHITHEDVYKAVYSAKITAYK